MNQLLTNLASQSSTLVSVDDERAVVPFYQNLDSSTLQNNISTVVIVILLNVVAILGWVLNWDG